jgi:hypothetical protein
MENLIGFILPPVIDIINVKISNVTLKFWVSFIVCLAVAVIFNLDKLTLADLPTLLGNVGIIFSEAQIVYKTYWANSSLRTSLQQKLI